tara:strand:- start:25225 stop:26148 length:924 start_codon:yes stop_codon:yes gene_type:complete
MGIIRSAPQAYYATGGDHGNYRYIPLNEIIDSFNATYVGKGKLCEEITNNDVTFHAIRALQELSYDTFRCTKDWEVVIPSTLVLVMPLDYVNYVKLAWSDGNGIERIIYPTGKTSNPLNVATVDDPLVQDWGGWDTDGATTDLVGSETSDTNTNYNSQSVNETYNSDADAVDDVQGRLIGGRYGIDPQHAQANGSFFIDESAGKFHFSSNISGKTVILKYISDGVTSTNSGGIDLTASLVPKLAEEAIYKWMLYGVLLAKKDTPGGLLGQLKKERSAETRKAKLRLSNLKIEELTQVLRGSSKHIKH